MSPVEFIKEFGWEYVIALLNDKEWSLKQYMAAYLVGDSDELKQYIEAYKLVQSYGGTDESKTFLKSEYRKISTPTTYHNLKQAISLVEEIEC